MIQESVLAKGAQLLETGEDASATLALMYGVPGRGAAGDSESEADGWLA